MTCFRRSSTVKVGSKSPSWLELLPRMPEGFTDNDIPWIESCSNMAETGWNKKILFGEDLPRQRSSPTNHRLDLVHNEMNKSLKERDRDVAEHRSILGQIEDTKTESLLRLIDVFYKLLCQRSDDISKFCLQKNEYLHSPGTHGKEQMA